MTYESVIILSVNSVCLFVVFCHSESFWSWVIVITVVPCRLKTAGVAVFGKLASAETDRGTNTGWGPDAVASINWIVTVSANSCECVCVCLCVSSREASLFSKSWISGSSDCKHRCQLPLCNSFTVISRSVYSCFLCRQRIRFFVLTSASKVVVSCIFHHVKDSGGKIFWSTMFY